MAQINCGSIADQALREYEARIETVKRHLDEIINSDDLEWAKYIAHNAKDILLHGL